MGLEEFVCKKCGKKNSLTKIKADSYICPECGKYHSVPSIERIKGLADEGSFIEWDSDMKTYNPLKDKEYYEKLINLQNKHNIKDAVLTGEIQINGLKTAIGVMDARFMMGSMGKYVGEKITRLFEQATKKKYPVIVFCCSGGARMQEGIIALMQMEKTAAAVKRHSEENLLYISVLTNPTMGGVTASFSTLADIIIAEKGAMIGFAGYKVVEQNTNETGIMVEQTAEAQLKHGCIDMILNREEIKPTLAFLLEFHCKKNKNIPLVRYDLSRLESSKLSPWEKVLNARSLNRPTSLMYIEKIFDGFCELHGDRLSEDDHAVVGGIAYFKGCPVTIIGTQKGKKSVEEALYRNWGMPSPSGYRKILRLIKDAEKFKRPVIFFIDTVGASCGEKAESRGQGLAIANLLQELSVVNIPILSIVIGEGGSGGALALGIGNEVWMLENSVYSILSPEGYASILYNDSKKANSVAEIMRLEATDLLELKVIDKIIKEPTPVTIDNMDDVCKQLEAEMSVFIRQHRHFEYFGERNKRYKRFRRY